MITCPNPQCSVPYNTILAPSFIVTKPHQQHDESSLDPHSASIQGASSQCNFLDLKPIENLWSVLKRQVDKQMPVSCGQVQELIWQEWIMSQDLTHKLQKYNILNIVFQYTVP